VGNKKIEQLNAIIDDLENMQTEIHAIAKGDDPRPRDAGASINTQLSLVRIEILHLREYIKKQEEEYLAHCVECDAEYHIKWRWRWTGKGNG